MKKIWILSLLGLSTLTACGFGSSETVEGDWEMVISNVETSGACLLAADEMVGQTADFALSRDEEGFLVVELEDVRLEAEQYWYWISAYGPSSSVASGDDSLSLPVDEEYMGEDDIGEESTEAEEDISVGMEPVDEEWIEESEIYYMFDALLLGTNTMDEE